MKVAAWDARLALLSAAASRTAVLIAAGGSEPARHRNVSCWSWPKRPPDRLGSGAWAATGEAPPIATSAAIRTAARRIVERTRCSIIGAPRRVERRVRPGRGEEGQGPRHRSVVGHPDRTRAGPAHAR